MAALQDRRLQAFMVRTQESQQSFPIARCCFRKKHQRSSGPQFRPAFGEIQSRLRRRVCPKGRRIRGNQCQRLPKCSRNDSLVASPGGVKKGGRSEGVSEVEEVHVGGVVGYDERSSRDGRWSQVFYWCRSISTSTINGSVKIKKRERNQQTHPFLIDTT